MIVDRIKQLTTEDQFLRIFDAMAENLNDKGLAEVVSRLDKDSRNILQKILTKQEDIHESDDKFIEKWKEHVRKLSECISQLGNEYGKYSDCEDSWRAEFAEYLFFDDLENIYGEMLNMLPRVKKLDLIGENYFFDIITKIVDGIDSYPEYMGTECCDFELGANGANCLLFWLWLNSKDVERFLLSANQVFSNTNLPVVRNFHPCFVNHITDNEASEMYRKLKKHGIKKSWSENLNDSKHFWHNIYRELCEKENPQEYLDLSAKYMDEN